MIILIITIILGCIVLLLFQVLKYSFKEINKQKKLVQKYFCFFYLMNRWVDLKQKKIDFAEYCIKSGYINIAIYGMGEIGQCLYNELKNTSVNVLYGIDQNADEIYSELSVIKLQDKLDKVDVVIVTAVLSFQKIKEQIANKVNCPIISLEEMMQKMDADL